MCSGSRDLFKFWEISDRPNISETVQDIDRPDCNGSRIKKIVCGLSNVTIVNALE